MRLIDADALLHGIDELAQSPWFNHGKKDTGIQRVGYNERKEAIEIVRDLCIKAAPTVGGWISVTERMPEERGRYLCWFGKNTFCVGAGIATYLPEWRGFGILESDTVLQNITHWMPLPEPPEENSNEI